MIVQGGVNQFQKGSIESTNKLFLTDEEIELIEKSERESLINSGIVINENKDSYSFTVSSIIDNGSILLFPSPTADYLNIEMDEEDYNDILSLEIIDALGRYEKIDINSRISVKHLKPGMYQLRFVFIHGFIVVKSFLKTE